MAGAPVFFMGLILLIFAALQVLLALGEGAATPNTVLPALVVGVLLTAMGFALRKHASFLILPAFLLVSCNFTFVAMTEPSYFLGVPAMMLFLSINGLRGWNWLRRNSDASKN